MKKTAVVLALALFAGIGLFTGCSQQEETLTSYAPEKADMIAYVNVRKISANKVGQAILAREDAKEQIAEVEKKTGLKIADMLNSEVAVFLDSRTFGGENPAVSAIGRFARTSCDLPEKIFASVKKEDKDVKEITVEGKKAVTDKDGNVAMIELSKTMVQISSKSGDKGFVVLKPGALTDLAKAIDTNALVSIAYRVSDNVRDFAKWFLPKEIIGDVTFVTANLIENKDSIDAEFVLMFTKAESAVAE